MNYVPYFEDYMEFLEEHGQGIGNPLKEYCLFLEYEYHIPIKDKLKDNLPMIYRLGLFYHKETLDYFLQKYGISKGEWRKMNR